jgi:glycine reductase
MPCWAKIRVLNVIKEGRKRMELKGKKVIVIGERDGVQGPAIEACVKSAGAEPVLIQTQCFV